MGLTHTDSTSRPVGTLCWIACA